MYSFRSTIRYSEVDEKGRLSMTALIDYLQDCSTFQSESLGVGLEYLKASHLGWYLAAWNIEIPDLPKFNDEIVVSTWAYGFRGLYGLRNFTIQSPDGKYYVKADSLWFLFDTKASVPVRAGEKDTAPYLKDTNPRLPMPELERKIEVPGNGRSADSVVVAKHHLDTNHHVNNAQYVEMAREAVAEEFKISRLAVQYKKAAVLGDEILPSVHQIDDGYVVDLADRNGESYAVVRMVRMQA